jgi:membrane associated rhomboid family serine protease
MNNTVPKIKYLKYYIVYLLVYFIFCLFFGAVLGGILGANGVPQDMIGPICGNAATVFGLIFGFFIWRWVIRTKIVAQFSNTTQQTSSEFLNKNSQEVKNTKEEI